MKITQLFKIYWPDNGGGIASVMESIAQCLPGCEHQVIVCQGKRLRKGADGKYRGVLVRRCRQLFTVASTPVSIDFLRQAKKYTKDTDIVICHAPYPMADLAVLLGMPARRIVVWWHCGFEKYAWLVPFYRPLVKHTLKKADLVLASSEGNVENSGLLLPYREKCRVVPFCVSDAYLKRGKAHAASLWKDGGLLQEAPDQSASRKKPIGILFIGRLVWYKGCEVLLKAFARMKRKNCRLVLVGSGILEEELKRLADSLGIKHVEFMGMVSEEEKQKQIEACDFLVLPSVSKAEAFGVVQIEAMAFGKPVINTALPSGVPDVSIDGVTGITVKPGSVRELARAMDALAGDERMRRAYGKNALQRVQETYTQQKMEEGYREIFRQLLRADH
ncbi:MAG: glycosyltransferase [Eubacterium sp.]|nr:glycosyltransferase [Eubacterium sp.]